jgi:hypothetical protein
MRIGRGNFFPAIDTTVVGSIDTRKWTLSGPDYGLLFDKRVIYDPSNPTVSPEVPSGKRTITKAFTYLMNHYVDVPSSLDISTHVDTIYDDDGEEMPYGSERRGSMYVGAGKTLREQMEDFADHSGIIYYIDADFAVHMHAYENTLNPWIITDRVVRGPHVRFRSGEYEEDSGRIYTQALVWGGSSIRREDGGPGGDVVFKKYPDTPVSGDKEQEAFDRITTYGRWQIGEEHAGESNYLTQESVNARAKIIINGPTGAVPTHGLEGGFSRPLERFLCTWFAHDVPDFEHIRPGYIQDIILYSQGTLANPLVLRLPLRSMQISFPTLPTDNPNTETYVQFEGEFGMAYSDRRFLWTWLRRHQMKKRRVRSITMVDNSSESVPAGSTGHFYPVETPDGSRTDFTFVDGSGSSIGFMVNQFDVFRNGLFQRPIMDYTYDAETQTLSFTTPPETGVTIWVTGLVTG